jgi:hypothetical protein
MLCCKTVAVVPEALMPPITGCVLTSYSACRQEKNASFFASRCIFLRHGVTCCPCPVTRDAHKSLSPCCLRCVVFLGRLRERDGEKTKRREHRLFLAGTPRTARNCSPSLALRLRSSVSAPPSASPPGPTAEGSCATCVSSALLGAAGTRVWETHNRNMLLRY